jgi:internalin A
MDEIISRRELISIIDQAIDENRTTLSLRNYGLRELPKEIGRLRTLQALYLEGNRINSFPSELEELQSLETLDISRNYLHGIPKVVFQIPSLRILDLSENQLNSIPPQIGQLTNLTELNLSRNRLFTLPGEIQQLINLELFDFSYNLVADCPREIKYLKNLTSLIIASNENMKAFPLEILELFELRLLYIDFLQLTELPDNFLVLKKLKKLDITGNPLKKFPLVITELENLEVLDANLIGMQSLPPEIQKLRNLRMLGIAGNNLTSLPTTIGELKNLERIWAVNNKITTLPFEINQIDGLKYLDLRSNHLPLPKEILEDELQDRKNIDRLQDNAKAILSYYFSVIKGQPRDINETKLLMVGQGANGKTSLVRRLIQDDFDFSERKTEGIAINHWQVPDQSKTEKQKSEIRVNIWDFGGQEIMHATHQFFLTKRSLYLLVLDSRLTQEENRAEYWLKIIQSFGGESPVLIVGNKIDQHPLDIDRTGLQKKYPNIVGILETSAATGAGIAELKAAITEQVNSLPHVRDLLPETWFTVKTALEGLGRETNFITHDKYLDLCAENEVSDETSQRTLIGFLHDLGVVLHFQDDPRLEALGILNPQWVTNGVYKILNSHALFQNKGVLTLSMLNEILNIDGYPRDKRLFIVDMMKKFELCYDIEPDKTFLVPDLLPKDQPDLKFNGIPAFEYAYPVLPSSVITRFIVRMNQKIDDGLVWRTGVVLKIGENKALVKADIEDKKITIAIDGLEHTRRDALSAIRYQLDEIHASIKGLNPERLVPVPGAVEAKPLAYNYLLMLEAQGIETLPVPDGNRLIMVNVRQVLSGVESEAQRKASAGNITNNYINYVGGNIGGSLIVGDENQVIQNSYNKIASAEIDPELKQTMQLLIEAVAAMNKELPPEKATEIEDDLGELVEEVTRPAPRQKWYSVSIEGLIKAAENLDKLGTPVISLSKKVLSLLTGGVVK